MRRIFAILLLCLAALAFIRAQESPALVGPLFEGSLQAGFVDTNLFSDPYIEAVPGFSSSFSAARLELKFSSKLARASIERSSYKGLITSRSQVGYELYLAADIADLYDFHESTSKISLSSDSSGYFLIQKMIDWYDNNYRRFGLSSKPTIYVAGGWPTTSYGSESGRYQFIKGETAEPIQWVVWSDDKWADAFALYTDIRKAILDTIEGITNNVTTGSGDHINQYSFASLTELEKAKVLREQEAHDDFIKAVYGSSSSFSIEGIHFRKAYLAVTNIGGVLDARMDFVGMQLSTGTLVKSPRAAQEDSGAALRLSLAPGLVRGLSLSLVGDFVSGDSSSSEDYNTYNMEYDPGEPSWFGLGLDVGADLSDYVPVGKFNLGLSLLSPDLIERPKTVSMSISADYKLDGDFSTRARIEGDGLLWDERYIADDSIFAFAAAGDISADYLGIGGALQGAWKMEGFGGTGPNRDEDRFTALSAVSDFKLANAGNAAYLDASLTYAPAAILGRDLGRVTGGSTFFFYGDDLALLGFGWYGSLEFGLEDLCLIPLTLDLDYTRYVNDGLMAYTDASSWPLADFLDGSTLSAKIIWKFSDKVSVSIEATDSDSGWKSDTDRVLELGFNAKVVY